MDETNTSCDNTDCPNGCPVDHCENFGDMSGCGGMLTRAELQPRLSERDERDARERADVNRLLAAAGNPPLNGRSAVDALIGRFAELEAQRERTATERHHLANWLRDKFGVVGALDSNLPLVERVITTVDERIAELEARVTELQEANTREVERRQSADGWLPYGVRWNAERSHYEEEGCLGCGAATASERDCGCPAGTGWRRARSFPAMRDAKESIKWLRELRNAAMKRAEEAERQLGEVNAKLAKAREGLTAIRNCIGGDDQSSGWSAPEDVWGYADDTLAALSEQPEVRRSEEMTATVRGLELLCTYVYGSGLRCGQPRSAVWHRKDCTAYRAHSFKPPSYFERVHNAVIRIIRSNDYRLRRGVDRKVVGGACNK